MRRIIKRTLTIMTRTTWTISWREDSIPVSVDPQADPIMDEFARPNIPQRTVQEIQRVPPVIEAK